MTSLPKSLTRIISAGVVAAVVVAAVVYFVFGGSSDKTLTARFASAIGIYSGTPVKILGVNVGSVTGVHPMGDYVEVTMTYDSKYELPSNVTAVEVANSLVSDRYVQLTPAIHTAQASSQVLPSGATIDQNHTSGPAELDDIYKALDTLAVALGPAGVNKGGTKDGALTELLRVASANLKGNGQALGESISRLAAAAQTLADQREGLFGTVRNLQKFTDTLKASDAQVHKFNEQLAQVAGDLASERGDLGAALQQLGLALDSVATFVRDNAGKFHTDFVGLKNVLKILVDQRASLNETLAIAPVALANIVHAYQPATGTIGTRGNLLSLTKVNPQQIVCGLLSNAPGGLLGSLGSLGATLGSALSKACKGLIPSKLSDNARSLTQPTLMGAGS